MAHDGDLALDANGDLLLSSGDLQLVTGAASIVSDVRARLQFFRGEWFLDESKGLPYFQFILTKAPSLPTVQALLRAELMDTPGITDVLELKLIRDPSTRRLSASFRATADTGQLVTDTVEITTP